MIRGTKSTAEIPKHHLQHDTTIDVQESTEEVVNLRKSLAESENENMKLKEALVRVDACDITMQHGTIDIAELLCRTVVAEVVRAERDELAARVAILESQLSEGRRDHEVQPNIAMENHTPLTSQR